jgi:uncharacterized membrane protein YkvA (DUF1232 family)
VQLLALWKLFRHEATPWFVKAIAVAVVAYAVSPIDLIPDFIPVLGQLDDLILQAGKAIFEGQVTSRKLTLATSGKGRIHKGAQIQKDANLCVQQLHLLKGALHNHGTLVGEPDATITLHKGATLINHHRLKMMGASQWTAADSKVGGNALFPRVKNVADAYKTRDQRGHLWFHGPLHTQGLELENNGLFQADSVVSGSLLRLKNKGDLEAALFGTGEAFTVDHLLNDGTLRGAGHLRVGEGQNMGVLTGFVTGARVLPAETETVAGTVAETGFETGVDGDTGLSLEVETAFKNTKALQLKTLTGTGRLTNEGTLKVSDALSLTQTHNTGTLELQELARPATLTNSGTATFGHTPDLR